MGLLLHPANPPKSDDKYVEKSVQLVRGSSFQNDLLQNPYFKYQLLNEIELVNITYLKILQLILDPKPM